jgi:hypothetical protein
MMSEILDTSEDLGKALQKKKQDIVNTVRLVHSTKVLLEEMRSDEGWELFILTVIEFYAERSIDIPDLEATYILRGGRARRQPDHFTIERYLRVEIFRATIDNQLTKLNLRFNEKEMDLLSISVTLIPGQDMDLHLSVLKKYAKWWRNTIRLILHNKGGMG